MSLKKDHPDYDKPGFTVRAMKQGYYGHVLREPGDVFKIQFARHFADYEDDALSGLGWMEKVDGASPKRGRSQSAEPRGAKPPPPDPSERDSRVNAFERTSVNDDVEAEVI